MNGRTFNRLHALRMDNDAAKYRQEEMAPRFVRLAARHENGAAPRAVSAFQLFQTPPQLAARLAHALKLNRESRVLEPSAGLGRIVFALQAYTADITAVEVAPQCAGELYSRNDHGLKILQRDFLACTVADLGTFDAVAMNPPFHMRADIRHILHARTFLKPGGKLAALCFDTHAREKALRHLCATWEKIPAGTFGKEGTSVPTVLLTMEAV